MRLIPLPISALTASPSVRNKETGICIECGRFLLPHYLMLDETEEYDMMVNILGIVEKC